jgi:hypothetical protein
LIDDTHAMHIFIRKQKLIAKKTLFRGIKNVKTCCVWSKWPDAFLKKEGLI